MKVNENLIRLIKLLNSDVDKATEFSKKKSKKELYEYCVSLVPGYSEDEFTEFMKILSEYSKDKDSISQISESDLESVSGGMGTDAYGALLNIVNAFQEGSAEGNKIIEKLNSLYLKS